MKLSSILCGAAAIALLATSAEAHWGWPGKPGNPGGNEPGAPSAPATSWGEHVTGLRPVDHDPYGNYAGTNDTRAGTESRWAATYEGKDNVGDAGQTDGATFTLRGTVSPHCVFYTGSSDDLNFNFGRIGIYASENHGPALAFDQVEGAKLKFRTNVAGCNTKNSVTLDRDSAYLEAAVDFGYDAEQFTNKIPFDVVAKFKAPNVSQGSHQARDVNLSLEGSSTRPASREYGAWKSPMEIVVDLGTAQKSLVAGDYTGSFSVTIQAL